MKRRDFLLSVRREYSTSARMLFALLALIQFIAPTWHVCEMSGVSCCPPQKSASVQHCARPSTPATALAPNCEECPEARKQKTSFFVQATPEPHAENCLAKMLLGMPWQTPASTADAEYSLQLRALPAREYSFESSFFSLLPPGRAPPVLS